MKKSLFISIMAIFLGMVISTVCFASENPYVKKEQVNTICTGIQGEQVQFIGKGIPQTSAINLQVKNQKTGQTDLVLEYTSPKLNSGKYTSNFLIHRMNISNKSFWIVQAYDDGPRYFSVNKLWVIGEYSGKYITFLTENIFHDVNNIRSEFGSIETGPARGGEAPAKSAIIFTNGYGNNEQRIAAYWDETAKWFGYTNVGNLPYGAWSYSFGNWRIIKK